MVRNIRNFWIEVDIDGRKEKLVGGPKNKGGGFHLVVKMRQEGHITTPVEIVGQAQDGNLNLISFIEGEEPITISASR